MKLAKYQIAQNIASLPHIKRKDLSKIKVFNTVVFRRGLGAQLITGVVIDKTNSVHNQLRVLFFVGKSKTPDSYWIDFSNVIEVLPTTFEIPFVPVHLLEQITSPVQLPLK